MWIREYKQLCTKIWEEIREAEAVVTGGIPVKSCPGKLCKIDTKTLVKLHDWLCNFTKNRTPLE